MPMVQAAEIPADLKALHVLNRLAYGPRPRDVQRVNTIGVERYVQEQLSPDSIPMPQGLTQRLAELDTLRMTPVELFVKYGRPELAAARKGAKPDQAQRKEARPRAQVIVQQAVAARLMCATESPRQLHEVMVDFWFNHFNVFAAKGLDHLWVGAYETQAIRPHVLGRFRDLLEATAKHPAMLFYLDNWQNTAPNSPGAHGKFEGLNENYARELMELHTLGVNGGYTQNDVIALARILTGWGLRKPRTRDGVVQPGGIGGFGARGFGRRWRMRHPPDGGSGDANGFYFDPSRHDFADKVLLGYQIKGSGIGEVEQALDILARSPATARHISYQLAQFFVADDPPDTLVRRLADRFAASDGDIRAVLTSLFQSREFWDRRYFGAKFKTPQQYVISTVRAAGIEVVNFRPLAGASQRLGMPFYGCQTPDGYKNTQEAWLNPDAMMIRLSLATGLGSGHMPLNRAPLDGMDSDERVTPVATASADGPDGAARPLDPFALMLTLGNDFSSRTMAAIEAAPVALRAALILGSPEFMHR